MNDKPISITLFGKPIPHKDYSGSGRYSYDSQSTLKDRLRWEVRAQFKGHPLKGPVQVDHTYYFPIPKHKLKRFNQDPHKYQYFTNRPDGDNLNKLYNDILKTLVFDDDCWIVNGNTRKLYDPLPRSVFIITPLGPTYERL